MGDCGKVSGESPASGLVEKLSSAPLYANLMRSVGVKHCNEEPEPTVIVPFGIESGLNIVQGD